MSTKVVGDASLGAKEGILRLASGNEKVATHPRLWSIPIRQDILDETGEVVLKVSS